MRQYPDSAEGSMADIPEVTTAGEYGATTVALSADGSSLRIAFGRRGNNGPVYHGAVILTTEAVRELKQKLEDFGT